MIIYEKNENLFVKETRKNGAIEPTGMSQNIYNRDMANHCLLVSF